MAPDGKVTGTPSAVGRYLILVSAQDNASQSATPRSFSIDIDSGLVPYFGNYIPPGAKGAPFNFSFYVVDSTGSMAGITITLQSGSLPAGLTLSTAGLLSGTPTGQGYYYFTIRATKGTAYLDIPVKVQINAQFSTSGMLAEISDGLKNLSVGTKISGQITLRWPFETMPVGVAPYQWTLSAGTLPSGLTLRSDGFIKGATRAPTPPNYVQPTFTVTDQLGSSLSFQLTGENILQVATPIVNPRPYEFVVAKASGELRTVNFLAQVFGDGSDGACTLDGAVVVPWADKSGNIYSLNRDVYLTDLSFSGGASIRTNGFRIFGTGKLQLDGCAANTISFAGSDGTNATSTGPGAGGEIDRGTVSGSLAGGRGGLGAVSGAGTAPVPLHPYSASPGNGGNVGNFGLPTGGVGAGGNGTSSNGSTGGIPDIVSGATAIRTGFQPLMRGEAMLRGGAPGYGGGYGGNDGLNRGGNGGGGGSGGGVLVLSFFEISTSATTAARCINAPGGNGGNGFCSSATANIGGGGGGSGGGGGYVHVVLATRSGPTVTSLIGANGGNGGSGAINTLNSARNGKGGDGASGGRITVINVFEQTVVLSAQGAVPSAPSGVPGAAGTSVSLSL